MTNTQNQSGKKRLKPEEGIFGDMLFEQTPFNRTASDWAKGAFPKVAAIIAIPFLEQKVTGTVVDKYQVLNLNDQFFALALGHTGNPETPTVYLPKEKQFYTYNKDEGIYLPVDEQKLITELTILLDACMSSVGVANVTDRFFALKNPERLQKVVDRAKDLLTADKPFFLEGWEHYLPLANGIYEHATGKLLPFNPKFHFRSTLPVKYDEGAGCPIFTAWLKQVMDQPDIDLLQKYLGQLVLGKNHAQRILILSGAAGWGKGSLVRMVQGVFGMKNIGVLRDNLFRDQYELSRYHGKALLYHPDMPSTFLDHGEASLMKQIVGGDPLWANKPSCPNPLELQGDFNVILCCNGIPVIRLDGDAEAWRRRLAVVEFKEPNVERHGKISDLLLMAEASGFMNWLLAGKQKLYEDKYVLKLNEEQHNRVDRIVIQFDPTELFLRRMLAPHPDGMLTVADCYHEYRHFCMEKDLPVTDRSSFNKRIAYLVNEKYGLGLRNDVKGNSGRQKRGWKGLMCAPGMGVTKGSREMGSGST
jgi:putative DNA primase/helicase